MSQNIRLAPSLFVFSVSYRGNNFMEGNAKEQKSKARLIISFHKIIFSVRH